MYKFRKLSGCYQIEVLTTYSNEDTSAYSAEIVLDATYVSGDRTYLFELKNRKNVRINAAHVTQIVDIFMLRLSDSYYPIKLLVSPNGKIISVVNFDEIKKRWLTELNSIFTEWRCIAYEQYIDSVKDSFDDEAAFLDALKKDSFIQLYFNNYQEPFCVTCYNFPIRGESYDYEFKHDKVSSMLLNTIKYISTENDCKGTLTCEYSEYMDIVSLSSKFIYPKLQGGDIKQINIIAKERDIKRIRSLNL